MLSNRKSLIVNGLLFLVASFLITGGIYAQEVPQKEDWIGNIVYWTEQIQKNPNNQLNYYDRGIVFMEKGEFEKAIQDFSKALEMGPDTLNPLAKRMECYLAIKDYDNAWEDLHKAEERPKTDSALLDNLFTDFRKKLQEASGRKE